MEDVAFIMATEDCSMAMKTDNTLWIWGRNHLAQVGDDTYRQKSTPIKILDNVAFAYLGRRHVLAADVDGTLYTWGVNTHGQIGNGTKASSFDVDLGTLEDGAIVWDRRFDQTFPAPIELGEYGGEDENN